MDDFEHDNDKDFELEITDLPPDEERSISGTLIELGSHLLNRMGNVRMPHKAAGTSEDAFSQEDTEIEIIDLPHDDSCNLAGDLVTFGSRFTYPSRRRSLQLVITSTTLILVSLLIFSSVPNAGDRALALLLHPTPVPTATQVGIEGISSIHIGVSSSNGVTHWQLIGTPGAIPGDCPSGVIIASNTDSSQGSGHDGSPVWIDVLGESSTSVRINDNSLRTTGGRARVIRLNIASRDISLVTLNGENIQDGVSLSFAGALDGHPTEFFILDPQQTSVHAMTPNPENPEQRAWYLFMYIPESGCYSLKVGWDGGMWEITFASG